MKTSLNKHKRSAAGLLIAVAAFAAALTGCQKDFEMDLPLAVAARELSLSKEAGSTHVLVYSNGEWTARFTRNVKWASLNKLEGYGNHEIVFTYAANYGISRKVGVVFQKGELADTVMFTQAGTVTEPSLASNVAMSASGKRTTSPPQLTPWLKARSTVALLTPLVKSGMPQF